VFYVRDLRRLTKMRRNSPDRFPLSPRRTWAAAWSGRCRIRFRSARGSSYYNPPAVFKVNRGPFLIKYLQNSPKWTRSAGDEGSHGHHLEEVRQSLVRQAAGQAEAPVLFRNRFTLLFMVKQNPEKNELFGGICAIRSARFSPSF
jgi:hypothetical protein